MRIAVVTTYPPRPCGIATFTADLRQAVVEADGSAQVEVVALTTDTGQELAPEVLMPLRQHTRGDYRRVAAALNSSGVEVVLLQHEYGIYGGECGEYVLDLTEALDLPYVVTLHTVLTRPSRQQADIARALCRGAAEVTVMSATARTLLVNAGLASADGITVLNHGAPVELRGGNTPGRSRAAGLPELDAHADRTIVSTFGLLSSGKGIEVALRALRRVVEAHPDVLYVVAGRTHPEVAAREGEQYRNHLEHLSEELGLGSHVLFLNRFLTDDEVCHLLGTTDVFLTPYRSEEQVVSGVLTFALVAGCPVVSTPYHYAADLLSTGAGVLVPFDDHASMGEALLRLLDEPDARAAAAHRARTIGAEHTWPEVGRGVLKVLGRAAEAHEVARTAQVPDRSACVDARRPQLSHLSRLADRLGIVQHARGIEPDLSTGYCVDDVARLAIVANGMLERGHSDSWLPETVWTSLAFLESAWEPEAGAMRNFRHADGSWLDDPHPGDHLGRAVWALGELAATTSDRALRESSLRMLARVVDGGLRLEAPRSVAFALMGLGRLPDECLRERGTDLVAELSERLVGLYHQNSTEGWRWYEDRLTYDNARIPQSLLVAAARARGASRSTLASALEALEWYGHQCEVDSGAVTLVGNLWRTRADGSARLPGEWLDEGDEQPLDAAALAEAFVDAYRATGSDMHRQRALSAFAWFHGGNRWRRSLFNADTGGCHDGVGRGGVNVNQGAESTLAYFQARLALEAAGLWSRGGPV